MSEDQNTAPAPPSSADHTEAPPSPPRPPPFDPSRSVIKRKVLIKELAAMYHAECLAQCQDLLELQRQWEEQHENTKTLEDMGKMMQPCKRLKKSS